MSNIIIITAVHEELPPCSDRLQQLMSHMTFHEGAETEGGDPPGSAQHLQGPVPGVAQRGPHCWIPMVPATHTHTRTEMHHQISSMQTHFVLGTCVLGLICLRFMCLGLMCLCDSIRLCKMR